MKQILIKTLCVCLAVCCLTGSLCGCKKKTDTENVRYIAYTDNSVYAQDGVVSNTAFVSDYTLDDLWEQADDVIDGGKYLIIDLSKIMTSYANRIKNVGEENAMSLNLTDKPLLYTETALAFYVGLPEEYGLTEAQVLTFINYEKEYVDDVLWLTAYSSSFSAEYLATFSGAVVSDKSQLSSVPDGMALWAMGAVDTVDTLITERTEGVLVSGEKTADVLAKEIVQRNPDASARYASTLDKIGFFCPGDCYEEIAALGCTNLTFCTESPFSENLMTAVDRLAEDGFQHILIYMNDLCYGEINGWNNEVAYRYLGAVIKKYGDRVILYAEEPSMYFKDENADVFLHQTKALRESFPDNRLLVCEIYGAVNNTEYYREYLQYCTDITYDIYQVRDTDAFRQDIVGLIKIGTNGQRFWLVPWACAVNNATAKNLINNINRLYALAKRFPRIVGLLPFAYIDAPSGGDWGNGLRSYFDKDNTLYSETLYNTYMTIGQEICGK